MEEKMLQTDKTSKSILDRIIAIIIVVSYFAAVAYAVFIRIGMEFFVLFSIAMTTSLCIGPLIEYIKKASKGNGENNIHAALRLGYITALVSGTLFITYETIFSEAIILDKNYYIYDCFAVFVIVNIIFIQIITIVKKTKTLIIEKAGFFICFGNVIWSIIVIFFVTIIPVSKFYMPKRIVDLGNIKRPAEFKLFEISEGKPGDWKKTESDMGYIVDDSFAELFQSEISKLKAENMRGLDKINYVLRNLKGESYIEIYLYYETKFGNSISFHGVDDGYISRIMVHKNGEVILHNFDIDTPGLFFNKGADYYRIILPDDFEKELRRVIKKRQE